MPCVGPVPLSAQLEAAHSASLEQLPVIGGEVRGSVECDLLFRVFQKGPDDIFLDALTRPQTLGISVCQQQSLRLIEAFTPNDQGLIAVARQNDAYFRFMPVNSDLGYTLARVSEHHARTWPALKCSGRSTCLFLLFRAPQP